MAILSVGFGVSSLVCNGMEAIMLAIGEQDFGQINVYYGITGALLVLAACAYFIERSSNFTLYYTNQGSGDRASMADPQVSCSQVASANWIAIKEALVKAW
jgi:hypothetical protein